MRDPVVCARIDPELAIWLDEYAQERASSRQTIIAEALQAFRELCQGGVPDLPPESA